MRIKRLTNSSVLKPGELLVVLHCLTKCGYDAFVGLRKSIGTGVVQFYRHRQEPVPGIRRVKNGRLHRHPKTTNERKAHFSNEATREDLESHGVAFKLRQKPKFAFAADLLGRSLYPVSAKLEKASWNSTKERGGIDHKIHSPVFWDR
jgi:hypothetical protein